MSGIDTLRDLMVDPVPYARQYLAELHANIDQPYQKVAVSSISGLAGSDSKLLSLVVFVTIVGVALVAAIGFLVWFFWKVSRL